jgi:hypothetical protein
VRLRWVANDVHTNTRSHMRRSSANTEGAPTDRPARLPEATLRRCPPK